MVYFSQKEILHCLYFVFYQRQIDAETAFANRNNKIAGLSKITVSLLNVN
jgi:hypothetical protein